MANKYAPVLVFAFNRPKCTKALLENLSGLDEAKYTDVYIFSDNYAKGDAKNQKKVKCVRKIIEDYKNRNLFLSTNVTYAMGNKGLANSIIDGVTEVIKKYKAAIVLEDDLLVSDDFLRYMNRALDFYEEEKDVWAISAYSFPMKALANYKHDVFSTGRGCSWGWATWSDRWSSVDWELNDYEAQKKNRKIRKKFAEWGRDLPLTLDNYKNGKNDSWAVRWCYSASVHNKYTIYPVNSRVINTGTDGSGTHYNNKYLKYGARFSTTLNSKEECNFEMLKPEQRIRKEFMNRYMTRIEYLKYMIRLTIDSAMNKRGFMK